MSKNENIPVRFNDENFQVDFNCRKENFPTETPPPPSKSRSPSKPSSQIEAVRQGKIRYLDFIYDVVKKKRSIFLDQTDLESLSIERHNLELLEDGTVGNPTVQQFFKPLSQEKLNDHPIDFEHSEGVRDRGAIQRLLFQRSPEHQAYPMRGADEIWHHICWKFHCPRKGLSGTKRLWSLTPWIPGSCNETVFHPYFRLTIFEEQRPDWSPATGWQIHPDESYPHAMFILRHNIEGEDRLLRGEILAIIASMITRLELPRFSEHVTVTVLVFSLMGKRHGRILQAFCNDKGLTISMSKLFDFTTLEKAEESSQIFLQHMANRPVGETTYQPSP